MKLNGAQIVIETLIEQGTTTVFGYPGGQVINIYDALYLASDRIHHIITAHEQGASHAADGYARATGKVGVVIATSGPGATNLVTGIATAYLDSVPLVAITGNVPNYLIGRDSFQEVDITGVTIPSLENLLKDKASWLYFCPWYMNYLTSEQNNPAENLKEIYNSEYCITLDELPDLKSYPLDGGTSPEVLLGDINQDGSVNTADVVLLQKYLIQKATLTKAQGTAANYQKDAVIDVLDLLKLKRDIWKNL